MEITLIDARPNDADGQLVMTWRNDPVTLAMSYRQEPKVWETYRDEYLQFYFKLPGLPPVFALERGTRIGYAGFRPYSVSGLPGLVVEIGINIPPEHRGKGYAVPFLSAATARAHDWGADHVIAEIKQENLRSIRVFEAAGYIRLDTATRRTPFAEQPVPIYRYRASAGVWPPE